MKITISLILVLVLTVQCRPTQNLHTRRIEVIQASITAISQFDTIKLYKLVDTSYYFDLYGKEGFLFTIKNLNRKLKICKTEPDYSKLKVEVSSVNTQEYTLQFCKASNINNADSSFDLKFKFADFQNINKIMTIKINMLSEHIKFVPPQALPK